MLADEAVVSIGCVSGRVIISVIPSRLGLFWGGSTVIVMELVLSFTGVGVCSVSIVDGSVEGVFEAMVDSWVDGSMTNSGCKLVEVSHGLAMWMLSFTSVVDSMGGDSLFAA